jgi:hypothetical protein
VPDRVSMTSTDNNKSLRFVTGALGLLLLSATAQAASTRTEAPIPGSIQALPRKQVNNAIMKHLNPATMCTI